MVGMILREVNANCFGSSMQLFIPSPYVAHDSILNQIYRKAVTRDGWTKRGLFNLAASSASIAFA